jgi:hypothetical protein
MMTFGDDCCIGKRFVVQDGTTIELEPIIGTMPMLWKATGDGSVWALCGGGRWYRVGPSKTEEKKDEAK